jgi:hypothetical protein
MNYMILDEVIEKRVMTTDVMTEQIDEGFKAPPQTAYAQAC